MANESNISPALCRELLLYDPGSGKLFWRERPTSRFPREHVARTWNRRFANKEAFTSYMAHGCRQGHIFHNHLLAHRVCWAVYYGTWPEGSIDHIDGDPSNNCIDNLRDVSHRENCKNTKRPKDNKSGVMGVDYLSREKKWRATIANNGKHVHLGRFPTIEDAAEARKAAEIRFGFHSNHGR